MTAQARSEMAEREKMTEYEWRRLENIKRHGKMLEALKVHSRVNELSAAKRQSQRCMGVGTTHVFIGNMKRGIAVIPVASEKIVTTLESELVSAIPCRIDAHPCNFGMLAGDTSGGQVYIWTDLRVLEE